jgi:hypothetical protein
MSKYHVGFNLIKTVASPIRQAAETIKKTFVKPKKPKIGGQEKSKRIKEAVKIKKNVEKLEKQSEESIKKFKPMVSRSDLVGPTKNLRNIKRTKRDADKLIKESLKTGFKKGGRIGFKKGGDLGMQSVKYGIDNNPDITAADPKAKFIAANKKNKKSKKKVI